MSHTDGMSFGGIVIGGIVAVVGLAAVIAGAAWLFSFKGVDSGEIAFVREGGPFDGRNVTEVRQPGSGPKPIGAWNHQETLPVTERDLTDEVEQITVPTRDGVNVVVNGQALFRLTTDPEVAKKFYLAFGRRKWENESLSSDAGWSTFLRVRLIPILQDTLRQTLGQYECVQLNNTCVYVLNAEQALTEGSERAQEEAKQVNVTQVLQEAQDDITGLLQQKLETGLGGAYFEGVRFQNLRVTFTPEIQARVEAAQAKRAEVAEARLEAERSTQAAEGETAVAREQAKQIKLQGRAYLPSPAQAELDKIKALCGTEGCANLQVLGEGSIISNLAAGR
jgi:regulator of protease activity HflC (stomatin/prohibitin superfamily)